MCFSQSPSSRAGPLLCHTTKAAASLIFVIERQVGKQPSSPQGYWEGVVAAVGQAGEGHCL